jgi:ABC-type sugar transport system permease subunit
MLPGLIIYAIFFLWPLAQLIQLSSMNWKGIGEKRFVGFHNFVKLVSDDPLFWLSVKHNLYWLVAAIVVPVVIGLFLALLLVRTNLYGRIIYRTIFFLPQVLSSVVVAVIWRWIYNPTFGAINSVLRSIGLDSLAHSWLGEKPLALPALFLAWSWIHYGFCMVIFIAALQSIDDTYYDAAKVDGANTLQQLWYITLPFIRGALATVILITAIAAFQIFDLVFIITKGGPAWSTMVLSVYMYDNAFRISRVGYGAAVAVVLGIVVFVFSILFLRAKERLEPIQ